MDVDLDTVDLRGGLRRMLALGGESRLGSRARSPRRRPVEPRGTARPVGCGRRQSGAPPGIWLDGHYAQGRSRRRSRVRRRHCAPVISRPGLERPALQIGSRPCAQEHMAVRLGELLLREKRVTPAQLQEALNHQRTNGGRLGASLVKLGILDDDDITAVAQPAVRRAGDQPRRIRSRSGGRPADLRPRPPTKYNVIPVGRNGTTLTLAMADPDQRVRDGRHQVHDRAARRAGRRVRDARSATRSRGTYGTSRAAGNGSAKGADRPGQPGARGARHARRRASRSSPTRRRSTPRRSSGRAARRRSSSSSTR